MTRRTAKLTFDTLEIFYAKYDELPVSFGGILSSSDLKPGVYEGGFKIWECSIDLCKFLTSTDRIQVDGKRILELGCGAGLPGIVAMKKGAQHVQFQDFNEEVITMWTKVNVELNRGADNDTNCSFFAGDWAQMRMNSEEVERFDVVLSSETIYNIDSYDQLLDAIDSALTLDGISLLAAKSYYFGVGGSVEEFLNHVKRRNTFEAEIVWASTGAAIERHIIMLQRLRQ